MQKNVKTWLGSHNGSAVLLGVCPMTSEIVEATLREARQATNFTPMFIATPRQVDADRGYTGWSQSELVSFIEELSSAVDYDGETILARDHGGPYQSMRDRGDPSVDLSEAMDYATDVFFDDLDAGFDVLHVDATEDARADGILDLETVAERTATLIDEIEERRVSNDQEPVYYEVGTEEISGGMTEPDDFERYIHLLKEALAEQRPGVFERIIFVVGQVGTTMRIDMTNDFDPDQTERLCAIADENDLFVKVHYTDWLPNETLERFAEFGIGAANVGPEFAAAQIEALAELEATVKDADAVEPSAFMSTLEDAAVADAPWQKFAPDSLASANHDAYAEENRRNIALCVGRYVLTEPEVEAAQNQLYENVRRHTDIDPDEFVVSRISETIHRYVEAFSLA
ncbi:class II D-tagatose-bisphosphate aldolase non-catalytic subunit [Halorhabdus rudnickae]|uniref:class II D-tagatose-bisphosphate aldolase non-catalytic subunit n=1 Tax=Halorhabdus rudnickae TaxID=1775544 RepID=UPI0010824FD0|nr:class II D-tagatose-bisphosphate aldolase, non-catalytic subunit [Halorhabdus rudnickae]